FRRSAVSRSRPRDVFLQRLSRIRTISEHFRRVSSRLRRTSRTLTSPRSARRGGSAQEWMVFVSEEGQVTRFSMVRHREAAKSRLACAELQVVSSRCRPEFAGIRQCERPPKSLPFKLRHLPSGVIPTAAAVAGLVYLLAPPAFAQTDPGV